MTQDVVALVRARPDPRATVAAMAAAGPGLRVRHAADGAVLQLCESGGPPLVSIEVPLFLRVPGEIERLLGTEVARHVPLPVWWVEARAAERAPGRLDGGPIAARFAAELAGRLGGRVWRDAAGPAGPAAGLPAADAGGADAADLPGVDLLTERAALVVQNRPVVPLTAWLAAMLRRCGESGRTLQILTPPGARLTLPLRLTLAAQNGRWVVRNGADSATVATTATAAAAAARDGYDGYDGLTGAALRWDGAAFTPIEAPTGGGALAAAFASVPVPVGEQLICTFRASHPAAGGTRIGGAVELLCESVTGTPPGGWGTAEPAAQAWHREELTAFCRERVPNPTWLVVVGGLGPRRAVGTIFVSRTPRGVEEAVTLVAGERAGGGGGAGDGALPAPADQDRWAELAGRLVTEAGVESLFVQRAVDGPDGTTVPRWTGRPGPVGMALSDRAAREVGLDRAMHPPDVPVTRLGGGQGVWYALGDGVAEESGLRMRRLTQHLSGGGQVN